MLEGSEDFIKEFKNTMREVRLLLEKGKIDYLNFEIFQKLFNYEKMHSKLLSNTTASDKTFILIEAAEIFSLLRI
jgi:hypothetical protein